MEFLSRRPYFDLYFNTLAVSGIDGTLKHRLSAGQTRGYVYAKTGTLTGVAALSGFVQARSGRWLIFSLMVNNHRESARAIRQQAEAILRARHVLDQFIIEGIPTTLPFLRRIVVDDAFVRGDLDTGFVARMLAEEKAAAG